VYPFAELCIELLLIKDSWYKNQLLGLLDLFWRNTNSIAVSVHLDAAVTLDKLAGPGSFPERKNEIGLVLSVMLAHDFADSFGGLLGVVERNPGRVVVRNVGLNDLVEQVAADEAKVAVNSSRGAAGKIPLARVVVGQGRVGMLQVSDAD
jgi:hypothetical protein